MTVVCPEWLLLWLSEVVHVVGTPHMICICAAQHGSPHHGNLRGAWVLSSGSDNRVAGLDHLDSKTQ